MNAYKCDRCGALYERATVPDITVMKYNHGYGNERKDLCPNCQAALEQWLNKAEIEQEVTEKLYNEINKIIELLEFTVAINAESVAIHAEEIPLLLNGLKKQLEENERTKALFKPFNIPKK